MIELNWENLLLAARSVSTLPVAIAYLLTHITHRPEVMLFVSGSSMAGRKQRVGSEDTCLDRITL